MVAGDGKDNQTLFLIMKFKNAVTGRSPIKQAGGHLITHMFDAAAAGSHLPYCCGQYTCVCPLQIYICFGCLKRSASR